MSATIFEILQRVAGSIPGCAFTSIVDTQSGMSLASVRGGLPLDGSPEGADAYQSELHRLVQRALDALEANQRIQGLVLHSDAFTFISQPLPETEYTWHVVTALDTTVGFSQAMMRKHQADVLSSLVNLFD